MTMSLDHWLARRNPLVPEACPSKRARTDNHASRRSETVLSPVSPSRTLAKRVSKPRSARKLQTLSKLTRMEATRNARSDLPPEYLLGRRSLFGWSCSNAYQGNEHISALECLPGAPLAVLGLDDGTIDIIECTPGSDSAPRSGNCVLSRPIPPKWPIIDIAAIDSQSVVCASKRGTALVDLQTGTADFREHSDNEITHLAYNQEQLAIGGSRGSIGLLDIRTHHAYQNYLLDAHSTLTGPRANRQRPDISALAWAGPNMLASGSQVNSTVKFWDVRYMRKSPLQTTVASVGPEKGDAFGINALRSTGDGTVWALTRNSKLLKLNSQVDLPEYHLQSPKLKVSSPFQSLDLVLPGEGVKHGTNQSPKYPLIASCSDDGVILVTAPSDRAYEMNLDATYATRLSKRLEDSSLPANTTSVRWHPFMQELVTVVANRGWEMWTHNDNSTPVTKPVPIQLTALST